MFERIQQQAGFVELTEMHFDEATSLFLAGKLDAREVGNMSRIATKLTVIAKNCTYLCSLTSHSTRSFSRQLIVLFPGLLSSGSSFTRSIPPLHEIADVITLSRGDHDKLQRYKQFLVDFLEQLKRSSDVDQSQVLIGVAPYVYVQSKRRGFVVVHYD